MIQNALPKLGAVILAAGTASRYRQAGGAAPTKILADYHGRPMVGHVVAAALAIDAPPVVVVTGYCAAAVQTALAGYTVTIAHNADYETGLASSLNFGLAALSPDCAGALIMLADMPDVPVAVLTALCQAFAQNPQVKACVPIFAGQWGNPVLLSRALFAPCQALQGDAGARKLLMTMRDDVLEVPVTTDKIFADYDLPTQHVT